ncbi:MAG: hypothetical protein P8X63_06060 [Desulfuromonadaceae bacterium]
MPKHAAQEHPVLSFDFFVGDEHCPQKKVVDGSDEKILHGYGLVLLISASAMSIVSTIVLSSKILVSFDPSSFFIV